MFCTTANWHYSNFIFMAKLPIVYWIGISVVNIRALRNVFYESRALTEFGEYIFGVFFSFQSDVGPNERMKSKDEKRITVRIQFHRKRSQKGCYVSQSWIESFPFGEKGKLIWSASFSLSRFSISKRGHKRKGNRLREIRIGWME